MIKIPRTLFVLKSFVQHYASWNQGSSYCNFLPTLAQEGRRRGDLCSRDAEEWRNHGGEILFHPIPTCMLAL